MSNDVATDVVLTVDREGSTSNCYSLLQTSNDTNRNVTIYDTFVFHRDEQPKPFFELMRKLLKAKKFRRKICASYVYIKVSEQWTLQPFKGMDAFAMVAS